MYFSVCKGKNIHLQFKRGDKGIVTYKHIVISYSFIVSFDWRMLKGAGVIEPSDICHGKKLTILTFVCL